MSATRLAATVYAVDSSRLRCSRSTSGCKYESDSSKRVAGEFCPRCGTADGGTLEREQYTVDLRDYGLAGRCGCEHFRFRFEPRISAMSPAGREAIGDDGRATYRCRHIHEARDQAKVDNDLASCEELDEWLRREPEQEQEGNP